MVDGTSGSAAVNNVFLCLMPYSLATVDYESCNFECYNLVAVVDGSPCSASVDNRLCSLEFYSSTVMDN